MDGKRIVLFTSNIQGGMIQFAVKLLTTLVDLGYDAVCMIPQKAEVEIAERYSRYIQRYAYTGKRKGKLARILKSGDAVKQQADMILAQKPALVFFTDNPLWTTRVALKLSGKVKTLLTLHDGGMSHPTHDTSLQSKLRHRYEKRLNKKLIAKSESILLLSENTKVGFQKCHPNCPATVYTMNLPAHLPECEAKCPKDFTADDFYLFFGRIDKYKGIIHAVKAFNTMDSHGKKLVIAGKGVLTEEELREIHANDDIILMNRFISDEEMKWLFEHARATVLPYIEATQSGIIPIAYECALPVIVSEERGLTQFVIDGKTGIICHSVEDYAAAMTRLFDDELRNTMGQNAKAYSKEHLDLHKNIRSLIDRFGITPVGE